jgi:hypothetical protein
MFEEAARRELEKEPVGFSQASTSRTVGGVGQGVAVLGASVLLPMASETGAAKLLASRGVAPGVARGIGAAGVEAGVTGTYEGLRAATGGDVTSSDLAIDLAGVGLAGKFAPKLVELSNKQAVKEFSDIVSPSVIPEAKPSLVDDGTVIDLRHEPLNSPVAPKAQDVVESTVGLPTDQRIKAISESGMSPDELNEAYESLDALTKEKLTRTIKEANAMKNQVTGTEAIDADTLFLKSSMIPSMKDITIHRKPFGGEMVSYVSADGKTKFHEPLWMANEKGVDLSGAQVKDYLPNKSSVAEVGALLRKDGLGDAKLSDGAKNSVAEALGKAFRADRNAAGGVTELPVGTAYAQRRR